MTVPNDCVEIASYQLFAYQETSAAPQTTLWKKVSLLKKIKESFYLLRNSIVGKGSETGVLRNKQKEGHCGNSLFIWGSHIYVFSGIACRKQQPERGRHVAKKLITLTVWC